MSLKLRKVASSIALFAMLTVPASGQDRPGASVPQSNAPSRTGQGNPDRDGDPYFGAFSAAILAQRQAHTAEAADYYAEAFDKATAKQAVAERAFYQMVYAGRLVDASRMAASLTDPSGLSDDLVNLVRMLGPFKAGDWPQVLALSAATPQTGLSAFLVPVFEAWAHAGMSDSKKAVAALMPLENRGGLSSLIREQKAFIADFLGAEDDARSLYEALVVLDPPTSFQPHVQFAALLRKTDGTSAAQSFMQEQLRDHKGNQFLIREGARILSGRGLSSNAAHPHGAMSGILFRLASEFVRNNSRQAGAMYLRAAEFLDPRHEDVKLMLGAQFEQMRDYTTAASIYAGIDQTSVMYRVATQRRIAALREAGDYEALWPILDEALAENPDTRAFRQARADLLRENSQFEEAITEYSWLIDRIKQTTSGDWYLYFARGVALDELDKWDAAEIDMRKALALQPDEPTILNYLGYSWIDRGKNQSEATEMIEKALKARPDDGYINDSLGWVYFLQGNFDDAINYLELAVSLEPTDHVINDHLGDAYWRAGRRVEARYQWRQVLESQPEAALAEMLREKLQNGLKSEG